MNLQIREAQPGPTTMSSAHRTHRDPTLEDQRPRQGSSRRHKGSAPQSPSCPRRCSRVRNPRSVLLQRRLQTVWALACDGGEARGGSCCHPRGLPSQNFWERPHGDSLEPSSEHAVAWCPPRLASAQGGFHRGAAAVPSLLCSAVPPGADTPPLWRFAPLCAKGPPSDLQTLLSVL